MEVPIDFAIRSATAIDPDTLRLYAERRLAFALRRFEIRLRHVLVRLATTMGRSKESTPTVPSHCSYAMAGISRLKP